MKRLGKLIYTNSWEYQVWAVLMRDRNSTRVSVELYIVSPDGEMSDIVTITRKDIFTSKNCFSFFYDLLGDFTRDDIDKIKNTLISMIKDCSKSEVVQDKATLCEIHKGITDYVIKNVEDLEDNSTASIFIKDGYGYMKTECMDDFVKEYKYLGYKRLEILKRLKIMGALQNGNNRPYDVLVSINGEKYHFYKIKLAEVDNKEEKEDEVFSI